LAIVARTYAIEVIVEKNTIYIRKTNN